MSSEELSSASSLARRLFANNPHDTSSTAYPTANAARHIRPSSNLLGQNRLGFVRVNESPSNSERLFDGFRVGWNRPRAGLCYLDYLYDLNTQEEVPRERAWQKTPQTMVTTVFVSSRTRSAYACAPPSSLARTDSMAARMPPSRSCPTPLTRHARATASSSPLPPFAMALSR